MLSTCDIGIAIPQMGQLPVESGEGEDIMSGLVLGFVSFTIGSLSQFSPQETLIIYPYTILAAWSTSRV